ncbi:hypothetical protein LCGC14_2073780 [marine sediment metagenome]|uniref:Uncharacterized protein n=1 Tax=marine sediment metagenome TaxID=412755 RepID=A0A0F9HEM7_9ZZZZ
MPTIDDLPIVAPGDEVSAEHYNVIRALLARIVTGPGVLADSTGWHLLPMDGGDVSDLKFVRLNSALDGDFPANSVSAEAVELDVSAGQWDDTGETVDDVYPGYLLKAGKTLASGTRVLIGTFKDGRQYVMNAACST